MAMSSGSKRAPDAGTVLQERELRNIKAKTNVLLHMDAKRQKQEPDEYEEPGAAMKLLEKPRSMAIGRPAWMASRLWRMSQRWRRRRRRRRVVWRTLPTRRRGRRMKEIGRRRSLSRKKSLRRRKKIRRRKMAGEKAKGRKAKAAVARRDLQDESHGGLDTSGIRRAKAVAQVAAKKARAKANSTNGVASTAMEDTVQ